MSSPNPGSRPQENFWDKPWIYLLWLGLLLVPAATLMASARQLTGRLRWN
jgi:hypothetical protein